ncbi:MAG: efflux RND transporter periplasmic adaptor subunit [Myxococcota bacterium]|nr:efflux RND transporter periplasmic adaptor subunit [Myxococcota bacterium]
MSARDTVIPGTGRSEGHGGGDDLDPVAHRPSRRQLWRVALVGAIALAALLLAGILPRILRRASMGREESRASSGLSRLRVASAVRAAPRAHVLLPASIQPIQETSLFARTSGYVRRWYVDLGAEVKKDQLLVELDLPEVDEELRQARAGSAQAEAAIAQSKAQLQLARTTNDRYAVLGAGGLVSKQEVDQYASAYDVQRSNLAAAEAAKRSAEANVRRTEDLRGFGKILAPFDGVITMRAAEVGQLVVSGTGMGQALYKVAEVDVVRAFVNVPQLYAGAIKVGMPAPLTLREAPGRVFPGRVARTSNELDVATRALLTEVDVPNADRALVAGMYAQVSFDVERQGRLIIVPATSTLFDAKGPRVAIVRDGVVHWAPVQVDSDLGERLVIATGIAEGDLVAVTPSERLLEGAGCSPR